MINLSYLWSGAVAFRLLDRKITICEVSVYVDEGTSTDMLLRTASGETIESPISEVTLKNPNVKSTLPIKRLMVKDTTYVLKSVEWHPLLEAMTNQQVNTL